MPLPPLLKQVVERRFQNYCDTKIPTEYQNEIKLLYKIRGNSVTLIESRPVFRKPSQWSEMKIAQFRYDEKAHHWALYWADQNDRWHACPGMNPSKNIEDLFVRLEEDPHCVFWG